MPLAAAHLEREVTALLKHAVASGITPGATFSASGNFGPKNSLTTVNLAVGGLASHDATGARVRNIAPVNLATRYDLASVTKACSTLGVLRELSQRFSLAELASTRVASVLPTFTGTDRARVTIQDLLTHVWGSHWEVPTWPEFWALRSDAAAAHSPAEIRRRFLLRAQTQPLNTTPGTHFEYACTSFHVLMALVEHVSQRRFAELMRAEVLGPLELSDVEYGPLPPANVAPAYGAAGVPDNAVTVQQDQPGWHGLNSANSGLYAAAPTVRGLGEILLAGAAGPLARVLPHEYIAALSTPMVWVARGVDPRLGITDDATATARVIRGDAPASERETASFGHGLGFRIGDPGWFGGAPRSQRWGHAGYSGTIVSMNPPTGSVLALLTNRIHPSTLDPYERIAAGEPQVANPDLAGDLLEDGPRSIVELRQRLGDLVHS